MTMKAKHVRTGIKGELLIMATLKAHGYQVSFPENDFSGDLLAFCPIENRTYRIEVKASNRGKNGGFNFCLYREAKTDCRNSDVVALVFYDKKTVEIRFLDCLTVAGLKNLSFRSMPDKYTGKYNKLWHKDLTSVAIW